MASIAGTNSSNELEWCEHVCVEVEEKRTFSAYPRFEAILLGASAAGR